MQLPAHKSCISCKAALCGKNRTFLLVAEVLVLIVWLLFVCGVLFFYSRACSFSQGYFWFVCVFVFSFFIARSLSFGECVVFFLNILFRRPYRSLVRSNVCIDRENVRKKERQRKGHKRAINQILYGVKLL